MSKWFDANGTDVDANSDRAFKGGVYEGGVFGRKKEPCNCEFCEKCPTCGHRADEHMAGDLKAGICFKCQEEGRECK